MTTNDSQESNCCNKSYLLQNICFFFFFCMVPINSTVNWYLLCIVSLCSEVWWDEYNWKGNFLLQSLWLEMCFCCSFLGCHRKKVSGFIAVHYKKSITHIQGLIYAFFWFSLRTWSGESLGTRQCICCLLILHKFMI